MSFFQFSPDYSSLHAEMKKKSAQWHLLPSQKLRAQFKWASQNTWSVTTKKRNLKISHAPLIFLQAFMKQYYGMP